MVRQRLARFMRRGDLRSSALIAGIALGATLGALAANGFTLSRTSGTVVAAVVVPLVLLLAWMASAKMATDLADVHAVNRAEEERYQELERRLDGRLLSTFSEEDFTQLVRDEVDALPAWLRRAIDERNVAMVVDDDPPENPLTLGLYRMAGGTSEIILYRRTIQRSADDVGDLHRIVHETLLHELGHLFGMSERDLDRYTIGNNPILGATPVHPPVRRDR